MKKASLFLAGALMVVFCLQASGGKQQEQRNPSQLPAVVPSRSARADADFGKIPLQFIPNQGQTDGRVAYYVQGRDKTIYFTPEGLTFVLAEQMQEGGKNRPGFVEGTDPEPTRRWVVKLDFVDSNADAKPVGLEKSGAVISYFKGKPEEWKAGIPAYSKIIYRELWPGIDLLYYGTFNRMKYEFIVHPGAEPSLIKLAYRGAERVALTAEGRLEVKTPEGGFSDDNPAAYQEASGERKAIPVAYVLTPASGTESLTHVYGFEVGKYDRSRTLVLDPAVLVYCGYIGGVMWDEGWGIAVDGSGNAYITGFTGSPESTFPVTVGPDVTNDCITSNVFVAKVNASGTALVYCGYIGGSDGGYGQGIAVDGSGNAYVVGRAGRNLPVVIGPDLTFHGTGDAFVAKVNSSGTALVYCGYIGGSKNDTGEAIAVDGSGNAYVTGYTQSTEATLFPVAVGPDLTHNGSGDVFVARVNSAGTALDYCGYIGGSGHEMGSAIAVDGSGNAYVMGFTSSTESTFPVTVGPDLTHNGGEYDVFVAKVNSSGSALVYCGYIGGSGLDDGTGIAVDSSGNAYVTGITPSTESTFPVTVGPDLTYNGGVEDAFVAKVNASGTALVYCGYIGGSSDDYGRGIAVDSSGNAYVTGITNSTESTFPVTVGPGLTHNGGADIFVTRLNASGTTLDYCGYIGGSSNDYGRAIAVDGMRNVYVTGSTISAESTFPVAIGPDLTYNGNEDAIVAKISTPFTFYGFDRPIDNEPTVNNAKAGSAIPVKWQITDLDGTPISDPASFKSLTSYGVSCGSFSEAPTEEVEEYSAGASGLQYLGGGYWQFNWKTTKSYSGTCRVMVLSLGDGSEHTAYFKFK
jgi:hypothetical protein